MDQWLSLKTVAAQTDTSVAFWRKAVARRLLPSTRIGSTVRLRRDDVQRFIAAGLRTRVAR